MTPPHTRSHRLGALVLMLFAALSTACVTEPPSAARRARASPPITSADGPTSSRCSPPRAHERSHRQWTKAIARVARKREVGVAVGAKGRVVDSFRGRRPRAPASNQKLLLSLALLDELGPRHRIPTRALSGKVRNDTIEGDLWVSGRGDPTLTDRQRAYWGDIDAPTLAALARRVERAGITDVTGGVMGATGYFRHDYDAPGWQSYVPGRYVQLPSTLAINGNYRGGREPELAAARAFARELERRGIDIGERAGSGDPPAKLSRVAVVRSRPLAQIVAFMNHTSNNFFAEMLGKLLGARIYGPPGTIAKGARAIDAWVRAEGGHARSYDSSGLSYKNRVSPAVIVKLLSGAESSPAGKALRDGLPSPGQGTLAYRLTGLQAHAKTGSLFNGAAALSGWVRPTESGRWITFSILARNVPAATLDRIVRVTARIGVRIPRLHRSDCPG